MLLDCLFVFYACTIGNWNKKTVLDDFKTTKTIENADSTMMANCKKKLNQIKIFNVS